MTNPYEAPKSVLESEILPLRKKIGWKIFFWFYLCFDLLGMASMLFSEDEAVFDIVGECVVYSFALLGIFAFAYNKKIGGPLLWRIVLLVLVVWDCYIFSSVFIGVDYSDLGLAPIIGMISFVVPILFLQYFALYQYAFRSNEIWDKA